jgi:biopolymer transport protein ExbD
MFGKKARRRQEPMEIDITSLLDILVILLVFLLKSYNASDLKLNLVKNVTLPDSKARKLGNHSVIVQVDQSQQIWVKNKPLGRANSRGEKIDILFDYLVNERKIATLDPKKPPKQINLVFDKNLPYKAMQKVMHTSASAGYTEFKFIVKGNF